MAFSANLLLSPNKALSSLHSFPNLRPFRRTSSHYPLVHPTTITFSASSMSKKTVVDIDFQHDKDSHASSTSASWTEFAKNVSGEWDGFGADFTNEGKPIELPEYVVPEAYREWEVKVFDWQTQCPTFAQPDDHLLTSKLIKLLPTVGCEADAATRYTIDERNIGGGGIDSKSCAFAYQPSGSYVAVWSMEEQSYKEDTIKLLEVEHCLVDPQNRESRVRVIQVLKVDVDGDGPKLKLRNIQVFCEQYYGPFRNGDQLGGCSIRDSAFAATAVLDASQIRGAWQARNSIARFPNNRRSNMKMIEQVVSNNNVQNLIRNDDDEDVIMLPKQLWCSLKETEDGETCSQVGWLFNPGAVITSKCIISNQINVKEIAMTYESAATVEDGEQL